MTDTSETGNLINGELGSRLLMIQQGQFDDLVRKGWFKPVTKNPARYQLVEVVQGYLKSLQHEKDRGRTLVEAAEHVCCASRTFSSYLDEGVITRMPREQGYNLDQVRNEAFKHLRALVSGHGTDGSGAGSLAAERAALAKEKRESMQLKNAIARGDYVSLAEIKRQWMPRLEVMRERLLSIPGKCGDELANRDKEYVEARIEEEISEALNELAEPTEFDGGPDRTQGS